jgi:hypothetical protein
VVGSRPEYPVRGMEGELELNPEPTVSQRRAVHRVLRAHPFLTLLVVGALVGGGLRYVPTTSASSGSSGAGQTACAAK